MTSSTSPENVTRRTYKNTETSIPLLGFGLMRLPTTEGKIDIPAGEAMVAHAMKSGCNYFDTAYMYHEGESEKFVGKVLTKYPRESYFLTSKMPIHDLTCEADNARIFNEQLERTGAGYFDFYFMHWLNGPHWEMAKKFKTWEFLTQMKAEGKIKHIGFSFHGEPEKLREIAEAHPWELAQIQLNYLDWDLCRAREQYEILTALHIPVAIMEPLRGGALVQLNEPSKKIFTDANPKASIASWGLRFAASLPNVQVVLSGMSNAEQINDNLKTFSPFVPLTDAEQDTIQKVLVEYRKTAAIPCTACRYCCPCPVGVDIPRNIALFNRHKIGDHVFTLKLVYEAMDEKTRASACVGCGACLAKCPQKIAIPGLMKETAEVLK